MINKDEFKGKWKQIKGKIKEQWGKLTDDELTEINGKREALLGKLQSKYGYAKEKAEQHLKQFESELDLESEEPLDKPAVHKSNGYRRKDDW